MNKKNQRHLIVLLLFFSILSCGGSEDKEVSAYESGLNKSLPILPMSNMDRGQICESYKSYFNQKYLGPETICAWAGVNKVVSAEGFGDNNPTLTCNNTVQECLKNPSIYERDYQLSVNGNLCILHFFLDELKPCPLTIAELERCINDKLEIEFSGITNFQCANGSYSDIGNDYFSRSYRPSSEVPSCQRIIEMCPGALD